MRFVILSSMTRGASYGEKMTPEFSLILLGLSFVSSGAEFGAFFAPNGVEGPAFSLSKSSTNFRLRTLYVNTIWRKGGKASPLTSRAFTDS
jgi:hypothetical protein